MKRYIVLMLSFLCLGVGRINYDGASGGASLVEDSVGTTELDDASDTPSAGECIKVASDTSQVEYASCAAGSGDIDAVGDCITGSCFTGASGTTLSSNTDIILDLDEDNNGTESLQVLDGADAIILEVHESGAIDGTELLTITNSVSGTTDLEEFIRLSDANLGSGEHMGILYQGRSANTGKGYFGFVRTENFGVGDFVFLLDDDNDDTAVATTDEIMRITSEGAVGLGISDPAATLEMATTDNTFALLMSGNLSSSAFAGLGFRGYTTTGSAIKSGIVHLRTGNFGVGDLVFIIDSVEDDAAGTINEEVARLTKDGNFELGTAAIDGEDIVIKKGAQAGDPQVTLALTDDANGDFSVTADTGDISLVPTGGDVKIGDDTNIALGAGSDWTVNYDESVDDQLLWETAKTAAIATTDPMFQILADTGSAGMTADQQVFGVAKGSQASNTDLFTIDEDGDAVFGGTLTTGGASSKLTFSGGAYLEGATANTINIGVDDTGFDVVHFGATASHKATWDESVDTLDFTGGYNLQLPRGTTSVAADCDNAAEAGRIWIDTDATSGQQVYVCEGVSGWVQQGGAGSGDVTGVGDCASGACLDGTSDGGTYIRLYDGDSNYTEINNGDANQSANLKWVLPNTNGTAGQVLEIASVASDTITLEWDDDGGGGGTQNFHWTLRPEEAKFPSSNPMVSDGGNNRWRGLFDASTDECATWENILYPYNAGALQAKALYSMASATSGTVELEISIDCLSDGDAADVDTESFGTVDSVSATVPGTAGYPDVLSDASLNGDSCAADDLIVVKICRDATNDTATGDMELRKVLIYE